MPMLGPDTNKQKVAALILARVKPGGKTEDVGESGDGKSPDSLSEGERSAGEEMLAAFEKKDVVALVSAFKSLWQILESTEEDESEPEQEENKPGFIG
jgi:hypothetical protein